ncbi:MAG: hypothetical protein ACK5A0_12270 [Polaromonas sp.]|jgi:hypothetical protein
MQSLDSETTYCAARLFDVVISMPPTAKLETIQELATTQAAMPHDRVKRLIEVLRSSPHARVGSGITLERAEEEKIRFTKAGLQVEIIPPLTLATTTSGSYGGMGPCPACGKISVMTKSGQCPSCGIFIDKLMQQDNEATEFQPPQAAINAEKSAPEPGKKDFEKEYGLSKGSLIEGKSGFLIGITLAALASLAYMGEIGVTIAGMSLPWGKKETVAAANLNVPSPQQTTGGSAAPAAAGASAAGEPTSDMDADDPLIQAAGGKRMGPKGLTMEEAVAAANALGQSAGNTNADRALAGGAGAGGAAAPLAGAAAVSKQTRQVLTAEFATLLADLGQDSRARQVLRSLGASIDPAADAQAAAALQEAQLKTQAWHVQRMDSAQARQAADGLKTKTQAIANAQERTHLQGAVAAILSRSTRLPAEVPHQFLSLAAESLKTASGPGPAALGDLAVSMAQVFLHETTARAKAGAWSQAKASAAQIEDLLKQAPDARAQANLYAVDHQAKLQTGQTDKATKSLEASLALAAKNNNLLERAIWLRNIARLSDAATQEQFDTATAALLAQLGGKSGLEKAQALTELSLLYTAAGLPARSSQYRMLAQSTSGLSAADTTAINTDLVVRGDMAMAKMLHGLGRYAEAEALLQRVGGYLF